MILKFFGVRGSYPVSGKNFIKYGGHTPSILIEISETAIIFDSGTGIIEAGNYINHNKKINEIYIFVSHLHYDHIQGLPFFKPFFNKDSKKIRIFGPNFTKDSFESLIEKFFASPFIPFSLELIKTENNISFHTFNSKKETIKIKENIIVKAEFNKNHPKHGVYMFSINSNKKKITYITDINITESILKSVVEFAKDSDILIFDSFFTEKEKIEEPEIGNFGHSSFEDGINVKKLSNSKKLFFFHFNPNCTDDKLIKLEKTYCGKGIKMAKEGLEAKL